MAVLVLSVATLLVTAWLILLGRADDTDMAQAVKAKLFDTHAGIEKLAVKEKLSREKLTAYGVQISSPGSITQKCMKLLLGRSFAKKRGKLEELASQLKNGVPAGINPFDMPGYVLQREFEAIGRSGLRKTMLSKSFELYGKKHAECKTAGLLAKMLSYPLIGVAGVFIIGSMFLSAGNTTVGLGIVAAGTGLVLTLVYGVYDELSDSVKKRRQTLGRQFPHVISKLALLVTSGMIMDRAWKETAQSQETELYIEMRRTSQELDNLVSPETAYGSFISRCNTKETAKLASAILQNRSKGNAEIGRLLREMAREVWQERRHTAKRDAEKANSKLMIPTMLLFIAILVMLMVPIAMNFSGIM